MLDTLQNNSEEAVTYLVNTVKGLKITDFDGENVDKVVSLIPGAVSWPSNMKTKSGNNAHLYDFAETLLKVFQTSSVPSFNALFEHLSKLSCLPLPTLVALVPPLIKFSSLPRIAFVV